MNIWQMNFGRFFLAGGPIMWPILKAVSAQASEGDTIIIAISRENLF